MIPVAGMSLTAPLLHSNGQIHIWVNRTRDLIRPRLIEGDGLRVARIDGEARISQLGRRIGIGDALTIVARANNVETACVRWVNELEWHARLDGYSAYREVSCIHLNLRYRAGGTRVIATRRFATTSRRDCPKKEQGKDE